MADVLGVDKANKLGEKLKDPANGNLGLKSLDNTDDQFMAQTQSLATVVTKTQTSEASRKSLLLLDKAILDFCRVRTVDIPVRRERFLLDADERLDFWLKFNDLKRTEVPELISQENSNSKISGFQNKNSVVSRKPLPLALWQQLLADIETEYVRSAPVGWLCLLFPVVGWAYCGLRSCVLWRRNNLIAQKWNEKLCKEGYDVRVTVRAHAEP